MIPNNVTWALSPTYPSITKRANSNVDQFFKGTSWFIHVHFTINYRNTSAASYSEGKHPFDCAQLRVCTHHGEQTTQCKPTTYKR
jgi:hypothetical protein